jgi:hypothetical protein
MKTSLKEALAEQTEMQGAAAQIIRTPGILKVPIRLPSVNPLSLNASMPFPSGMMQAISPPFYFQRDCT